MGREPEAFQAMRLNAEQRQYASHRALLQTGGRGCRATHPMSAVCRFTLQNHTQQLRDFFFVMSSWRPQPGFSVKSDEPLLEPSFASVTNRWVGGADPAHIHRLLAQKREGLVEGVWSITRPLYEQNPRPM